MCKANSGIWNCILQMKARSFDLIRREWKPSRHRGAFSHKRETLKRLLIRELEEGEFFDRLPCYILASFTHLKLSAILFKLPLIARIDYWHCGNPCVKIHGKPAAEMPQWPAPIKDTTYRVRVTGILTSGAGGQYPKELCGRTWLYSLRHCSINIFASVSLFIICSGV